MSGSTRPSATSLARIPVLVVDGYNGLRAGIAERGITRLVLDVEPVVVPWNAAPDRLAARIAEVCAWATAIPGLRELHFASNGRMAAPQLPDAAGLTVSFTSRSGKPHGPAGLISAALADPRPTAVCGDQPMTDGRLAQRLGGVFFYWQQPITSTPIWPLVQRWLGDRLVLDRLRLPGGAAASVPGVRR